MELIKSNYKQTEIGPIPEDWESSKVGNLTEFINGIAHEKIINPLGNYVVVNSKFVSSEGNVEKNCMELFNPAKKNDILMVMSDVPNGKAIAKCFLVDSDRKYSVNQRICILRSKESDPQFLFFQINRNKFYLQFDDGVKQTNLRREDVLNCPIPIPPTLSEQKAISTALSDVDALISSLEKLIAKKKAIKQGAMQELLTPPHKGGKRLSGFSGDWEEKQLDSILTFGSGQDYKHLNIGDIPVFGTGGVMTYVNDFLFDGESVGIGRKGTIDKPVFLTGKFWTVDTLFYTYNFNNCIPKYIFYLFLTIPWKEYNEASGVPSLNKNTLGKITVFMPDTVLEQKDIAQILSDMDLEIEGLEAKKEKYQGIKQGMMQELLTGKTRLV
jgi:type I restriction enzyme S subunit